MKAQCWVAHQPDMNPTSVTIGDITIRENTRVVLRQPRTITDRFSHGHVMNVPVRTAGPKTYQAKRIRSSSERCPKKVVGIVPVAKIAAQENVEHCEALLCREIRR